MTHMPLRDSCPRLSSCQGGSIIIIQLFCISFFFHSQMQQSHTRKVGHVRIVEMDCNCRIYFTSGQRRVILHFCCEILNEGTNAMMLLFS